MSCTMADAAATSDNGLDAVLVEELEALTAIFGDDVSVDGVRDLCASVEVRVRCGQDKAFELRAQLPRGYPTTAPLVSVGRAGDTGGACDTITKALAEKMGELPHPETPVLFELVSWVDDHTRTSQLSQEGDAVVTACNAHCVASNTTAADVGDGGAGDEGVGGGGKGVGGGGDGVGKSAFGAGFGDAPQSDGSLAADNGAAGMSHGDRPVIDVVGFRGDVGAEREGAGSVDFEQGSIGAVINPETGGREFPSVGEKDLHLFSRFRGDVGRGDDKAIFTDNDAGSGSATHHDGNGGGDKIRGEPADDLIELSGSLREEIATKNNEREEKLHELRKVVSWKACG